MIGAIAGDMIGSVYEAHPIKTTTFPLFSAGSCFTDDTVLTVATALAILEKIDYGRAYRMLARAYPDRGFGAAFARWFQAEAAPPYNSWGNGAAMRVSPIGWAFDDEAQVLSEAKQSAAVTHNHPAGVRGAQATTLAIWLARRGTDKEDIRHAADIQVDYLALSFPRDGADVREARDLLREAGGQGFIVAKIERAEAVENMDDILEAADVVMVARGDLGVEIGDAELPGVQKRLIERARRFSRVTITATQMMESMITSPIPTRAEVLDVANAVMDGTDAVMLSAETAAGQFPVKAVEAMDRVCRGAERQHVVTLAQHRVQRHFELTDEAIAMASMFTANHMDVKAIIALTESGNTALWLSRVRSGKPIYAFTRNEATCTRVTLYRGVYPIDFDVIKDEGKLVERVVKELLAHEVVEEGDRVILTRGDLSGVSGETNTLKILTV